MNSERPALPEPLPHPVVDNHCHLDIARGREEPALPVAEALDLAASVGVTRIVQIGCDLEGARWAVDTAEAHGAGRRGCGAAPQRGTAGWQPRDGWTRHSREIERLARGSDRVRAIGETGLDYYRTGEDGRAAQHESFRSHIELAKALDKTLVIHDRDAHEDVVRVLDEVGTPERWVMHCFSGDADFARACLDRGAYLSFAGTVTFKNAEPLREALLAAPLDRILVETDAPYLTPMPHRGRPNASYLVPLTVRSMAACRDIGVSELCEAIDANTSAAFGGTWGSGSV